jgi:hypothetical protein
MEKDEKNVQKSVIGEYLKIIKTYNYEEIEKLIEMLEANKHLKR